MTLIESAYLLYARLRPSLSVEAIKRRLAWIEPAASSAYNGAWQVLGRERGDRIRGLGNGIAVPLFQACRAACDNGWRSEANAIFRDIEHVLLRLMREAGVTPWMALQALRTPLASDQAARKASNRAWEEIGLATGTIDRKQAEAALRRFYAAYGLPVPDPILLLGEDGAEEQLEALVRGRGPYDRATLSGRRTVGAQDDLAILIQDFERYNTLCLYDAFARHSKKVLPLALRLQRADQRPSSLFDNRGRIQALQRHMQSHFWKLDERYGMNALPFFPLGRANMLDDCAVFDFATRIGYSYPPQVASLQQALCDATETCGWVLCFADFAIVIGRPLELHFDAENRLHHTSGPALRLADNVPQYFWHGVEVPRELIEAPHNITAATIRAEANAEVRRIMIERMGTENFTQAMGATEVHRDATGILWRANIAPPMSLLELFRRTGFANLSLEEQATIEARLAEDPWRDILQQGDIWQAVEVVNATAEPDGTYKHYFLAVPPEVQTAREAVAWTFGMSEEEYRPEVEK